MISRINKEYIEKIEDMRLIIDRLMRVEYESKNDITAYWLLLDRAKDSLGSIQLKLEQE